MDKPLKINKMIAIEKRIKKIDHQDSDINDKINQLLNIDSKYSYFFSITIKHGQRFGERVYYKDVISVSDIDFQDRRIMRHAKRNLHRRINQKQSAKEVKICKRHLELIPKCKDHNVNYFDIIANHPASQKTVDRICSKLEKAVEKGITRAEHFPKLSKVIYKMGVWF